MASPHQETDVWYGSYSGWTMLPSLVACVFLSGVIIWWSWTYLDRGWVRFAIITLFVLLWLVELCRWAYRFFGINYRLTNRRLFKSWGWRRCVLAWPLEKVNQVRIRRTWWEKWIGVGKLIVEGHAVRETLVLGGVRHPQAVAEKIRSLARQNRDASEAGN